MLFGGLLFGLGLFATSADLEITDCEFGEVYAFGTASCSVVVTNHANRALQISFAGKDALDSASPSSFAVPASGKKDVLLNLVIGNESGELAREFRVLCDDCRSAPENARASGFVMSALDVAKPQIIFRRVDLADGTSERSIDLKSHESADFRITQILSKPDQVDATVGADGKSLKVRIRQDARWGLMDEQIRLAIDTPNQKIASVRVTSDIHGVVDTESNPMWFGEFPAGADRTVFVPLRHREKREFRIGKVDLKNISGNVGVVDCAPAEAGCKTIKIVISSDQMPGITRGDLTVNFPELKNSLYMKVWGILDAPGGPGSDLPSNPTLPVSVWDTGVVESLKSGLFVSAPDVPSPRAETSSLSAPPPGNGPLLKWKATDESSAHGYQIFRADSEVGPFVLLNRKTIPPYGNAHVGETYLWRDNSAEHGRTYWYFVGVVYKDGRKEALSAPQRATAR